MNDLVKAISQGPSDPKEKGPVTVMILTSNGQIVAGSYTTKTPTITSTIDVLDDLEKLRPLVDALVVTGTSFVSQTGLDDQVCTLEWTITAPINAVKEKEAE